jgi:hypothetical protein
MFSIVFFIIIILNTSLSFEITIMANGSYVLDKYFNL